MKNSLGAWGRWRAWRARRSRVGRVVIWLLEVLVVALIFGQLRGFAHVMALVIIVCCLVALAPLLLILLYRWFSQRFLWKVRNRLILTYLLMGLAPVVLFATLAGIAGYLFAGQYATNSALSMLDQVTTEVKDEAASAAMFSSASEKTTVEPSASRRVASSASSSTLATSVTSISSTDSRISFAVLRNGVWRPLVHATANGSTDWIPVAGQPQPAWLQPSFHGVVTLHGKLYLCAVTSVMQEGRSLLVLGSVPLNEQTLAEMGKGLGSIEIFPGFTKLGDGSGDGDVAEGIDKAKVGAVKIGNVNIVAVKPGGEKAANAKADSAIADEDDFSSVSGGALPPRAHFYDAPVLFSAPVTIVSWKTGKEVQSLMVVASRPTVLYAHLFSTSTSIGIAVRAILITIAILFAFLEALALLMAAGLSRTITRSVADLYQGTKAIDAGHLEHRVRVARHDQLGALATSFNTMAASVSDLLEQQREKDRLINELSIAREVQTSLFPQSPATLGAFEMHAVCLPARTIGGDYYDFIFGQNSAGQSSALCLALGDISGKGISAALVMASLHSAVRAFILNSVAGEGSGPSPSVLLKQINRHLYGSTQLERYATLFLACYDSRSRKLTYANGGHLPPLVLSIDGTVRALDCGGPVVGLLNGLEYSEATVQLQPGDLLMAFSDGLTEPEKGEVEFGAERLLAYVRENRQQPLPVLAANTLKMVQAWIGENEQPDDMTLLLARLL